MKTVIILAGLIALAMGSAFPSLGGDIKVIAVKPELIKYQKKILALFEHFEQLDAHSEYYKIGTDYDINANIKNYSNKEAVEEFLLLYKSGTLPKYHKFSIFYERMRDEAIALFQVLYCAKDFDTLYKTASWAKVYMNEEQFFYSFYIAVVHRPDLDGIVLPAPYEIYPQFFFNMEVLLRMYRTKMQGGLFDVEAAAQYGIVKENDYYVYYANYSNALTYPNQEQKLSYFTEDVGLNSYYYHFHSQMPFWLQSETLSQGLSGESYYKFYVKLLIRYDLERLTNGLGEIPEFSWNANFETGYHPQMTSNYLPYAQRSNDYNINSEKNYKYIRFLDTCEKTFFQLLRNGKFNNSMMSGGNYWYMNQDLYSKHSGEDLHQYSYEIIARHVLGASPKPFDKYTFMPTALAFFQTSLRDPAFYQLYQRIVDYLVAYKEYVKPYSHDDLHFVGVKINDVKASEMSTYFDYFDFNATSCVFFSQEELKSYSTKFVVRQPRLNHKPFTVSIDVKSDVESDAVVKFFIGPKYDNNGYPVNIEEYWIKFYELDWFVQKLVPGENKIVRKSTEFVFFKDDPIPINEIYHWLDQGKVPYDMSVVPDNLPRRLMLPKGTSGGYPLQLFVFMYPYNSSNKGEGVFESYKLDNKPFGYPFDRPVREASFKQSNMYFEPIEIYHKDAYFPYKLNVPSYFFQKLADKLFKVAF